MQLMVNVVSMDGDPLPDYIWMWVDKMNIMDRPVPAGAADESEVVSQKRVKSSVRVRLFEERDIPKAREILRQHVATTTFRDQPFSDWKADRHFANVLSRPPRMLGITAEAKGEPAGLAWAVADSFMLTDGPLFVNVQLVAVDMDLGPTRRAKVFLSLVAAIKQWAQQQGASHTLVHVTTGSNIASTDRLMKAAGAEFVGGAYVT